MSANYFFLVHPFTPYSTLSIPFQSYPSPPLSSSLLQPTTLSPKTTLQNPTLAPPTPTHPTLVTQHTFPTNPTPAHPSLPHPLPQAYLTSLKHQINIGVWQVPTHGTK